MDAAVKVAMGPMDDLTQHDAMAAADMEVARLIHEASQPREDSREFMQPKTAKKRGRPRKYPEGFTGHPGSGSAPSPHGQQQPGAQAAPQAPAFDFKPACRGIFQMASGLMVRSVKSESVALLPEEVAALGDAWGDVCAQYAPDVFAKHGALLVACTVTAGVGFRVLQSADEEIKKRKRAQGDAHARDVEAAVNAPLVNGIPGNA